MHYIYLYIIYTYNSLSLYIHTHNPPLPSKGPEIRTKLQTASPRLPGGSSLTGKLPDCGSCEFSSADREKKIWHQPTAHTQGPKGASPELEDLQNPAAPRKSQ